MTALIIRPLLLLLGVLFAANALAQSILVIENPAERARYGKTYTQLDGFAASNSLTGMHIIAPTYLNNETWPTSTPTRNGRNLTLTSARSALGAWVSKLNVDYLYRREWWLDGTDGTLTLFELAHRNKLVTSARNLDIDYRWEGFDADGLRFSYAKKYALLGQQRNTTLGLSITALRVIRIRQESGSGSFTSNGSSATLNTQRDIWFSNAQPSQGNGTLTVFNPSITRDGSARGHGFTIDFGVRHDFGAGGAVRLAINDLLGRLNLKSVPHVVQQTNITAASDSAIFSDTSITQAYSEYDNLNIDLPAKYQMGIDYPLNYKWQLRGDYIQYRNETFTTLGTSVRLNDRLGLAADYDLHWKTYGLTMRYQQFVLGVRADHFSPSKMKAGGATMHLEFRF